MMTARVPFQKGRPSTAHTTPHPRVLYLYSGDRAGKYAVSGVFPDTGAYGLTHLAPLGFGARTTSVGERIPKWLARRMSFTLKHILSFFFIRKADVVIGPSVLLTALPLIVFKKPARFVLLNFSVNRQLGVHKTGWRRRLLVWQLAQMDAIISLSHVQDRELVDACPFLRGRTHMVRLGADVKYFMPPTAPRSAFILSGGRDNGRDYATVFDVARMMPARRFVIFCSRRNIEGLVVPANVEVRFDTPIDEVRELYRTARLLLLLTHGDNYGEGSDCSGQTVLLDAMASGMSVIASRKAYLEDYVADGVEAMIIPPHDALAAVQAIEALDDDVRRASLGRAARARIERELTSPRMAEGIARILKTLV